MIETSARLLALLSLLQVRREWTGLELADRLAVGVRTIRRDIDKLRTLGYPVEAAPGVAGGYRLGSGGEMPPLLLDEAEAVAVAVGLRTVAAGTIVGIEETSVRALAKLEQLLPPALRRRVSALSQATSAFDIEGPRIDANLLATIAGACRDGLRLHFAYVAGDEQRSRRWVEPSALVHSGHRWYLVAFDLDRDDWRTFRLDRVPSQAPIRVGEKGRRRTVPGGDPAAFVASRLRRQLGQSSGDNGELSPAHGRIRVKAPIARVRGRVPSRYATCEPDGDGACVITTRGPWSQAFLVWMATLDEPLEVLEPPELAALAARIAARLISTSTLALGSPSKPATVATGSAATATPAEP
jgi:predicted DNA-binding transcriptional regulator YafY